MTELIKTDSPLTEKQKQLLSAFLDTLIPASKDGRRPGAGETDFIVWLQERAQELVPLLVSVLDGLGEDFGSKSIEDRVTQVQDFGASHPELFEGLIFHTYACYYQDDRVLTGIGLDTRPPFPRGNSIESGDLALLDPVLEGSRTYRRV